MEPSLQRSIAERAELQLSLITDRQLRDLGVTPPRRRRLIRSGQLVVAGVHTFRIAGAHQTYASQIMAACLDVGGVASHRTAAYLHGLEEFSQIPDRIEVTIPEAQGRTRSERAIVHRSTNLGVKDLVVVNAIPTSSVARTVLELAALAPQAVAVGQVRNAVDAAVRDGKASDAWLWWNLERLRCRGRNGVAVMEHILQARRLGGETESWLEREFLLVVDRAGLPRPEVQRRISAAGAFVARVDCIYESRWLVVELNGHASHSTKRQRDADAARLNRLQLLGFRVLQFTYDDIVMRPEQVTATVAEALMFDPADAA